MVKQKQEAETSSYLTKTIDYLTKSNLPYIKPEHEKNVHHHKFSSSVDSLYFKYVQSPMCDWIVSKLPMWLAPNVITLTGFAFNIIPHLIIIALYDNEMEGPIDSWVCVMLGISYFIYSTLDNCDGKQARRTGSGSPMGMLFDHGLDATTTVVIMYPLGRIHSIGGGLTTLYFMMMSTVAFYYLTIEEYYLGHLKLPAISGPDDTSLLFSAFCFYTAYMGPEIWLAEYDIGFGKERLPRMFVWALCALEIFMVGSTVYTNLSAGKNTEVFQKRYKPLSFFIHMSYMVVLCSVFIGYKLAGSNVIDEYTKLTTMAYGAQFLHATLRTMVSSVTNETHMPYRRNILFSWLLMAINAASYLMRDEPVFNDFWLMVFINVLAWSTLAHYVYYVLQDFARILNINVFTIKQIEAKKPSVEAKKKGKCNTSPEKIINAKRTITTKKKVTKSN